MFCARLAGEPKSRKASPTSKRKRRGRGSRQMRASMESTSIGLGTRVASENQRASSPLEGDAVAAPPAPIRPPSAGRFRVYLVGGYTIKWRYPRSAWRRDWPDISDGAHGCLEKPPVLKSIAAAGLNRLGDPGSAKRRWPSLSRFAAAASRLVPDDSLATPSRCLAVNHYIAQNA